MADVEEVVDISDVVLQHRRDGDVTEKVSLAPDDGLGCPELQSLIFDADGRRGVAHYRYDPIVHVRVVPHERGLEVVVVAVTMHCADGGHLQQEAGQSIQEVVVQEKGVEGATEDEGVRDGAYLQLVVGESQVFQLLHAPHVAGQLV